MLSKKKTDEIKKRLEEAHNIKEEEKQQEIKLKKDEIRWVLGDSYEKIVKVLKDYVDMREDYYQLIATWIVGTYLYKNFETYPYLFINAMRGSGKTRLLKIISQLANKGKLLSSMRESVLFRTATNKTLCIDEFEGISKKQNDSLRELLNACYKKGMTVQRMKKVKFQNKEDYVVDEFEVYTPVAMANIWGMEEVLEDRCITIILEKSNDKQKTKMIEDFETNPEMQEIKKNLSVVSVVSVEMLTNIHYTKKWNDFLRETTHNNNTKLTTHTTQTTHSPSNPQNLIDEQNLISLFHKINNTNIDGRHLELAFPLFITTHFISNELLEKTIKIIEKIIEDKKIEEVTESRDVSFIDFIANAPDLEYRDKFIPVRALTNAFRDYINADKENREDDWINSRWVGRAIRRLNLKIDKKRHNRGVEIILDIDKAKEKLKMFRSLEKQEK